MTGRLIGLAMLIASAGAGAEVTDADAAGFGVLHERTVPLAPDAGYARFVGEAGQWWNGDHTWFGDAAALSIDGVAGGCFCERSDGRSVEHMRVGTAVPGALLRLLGGLGPLQPLGVSGALSVEFAAAEAGTAITLTYRVSGYAAEGLAEWAGPVDYVLAEQLDRYVAHVGAD